MRILLKSCPRCHGDLFIEHDIDSGKWWSCLQCGWEYEKAKILISHKALLDEKGNVLKFERKGTRLRGEPVEMREKE